MLTIAGDIISKDDLQCTIDFIEARMPQVQHVLVSHHLEEDAQGWRLESTEFDHFFTSNLQMQYTVFTRRVTVEHVKIIHTELCDAIRKTSHAGWEDNILRSSDLFAVYEVQCSLGYPMWERMQLRLLFASQVDLDKIFRLHEERLELSLIHI